MKRLILILLVALLFTTGTLWANDNTDKDIKAIRATMDKQLEGWNKGSVDAFMEGYWKSDKFTFQSSSRIHGFDALVAMYKKNYAGDKMGTLNFKDIEIKPLAKDLYLVLGRWHVVTIKKEEKQGLFTLIFRKIDGKWKIIHDHSS
jgi:uncharacterized protein (TIGR02246 family)